MELERIRAALVDAVAMRSPKWDPDDPPNPRDKIERLENYLLESAYAHGELEEALFWTDALIKHYTDKVEQMTGYEVALARKPRERITQADINRAKRTVDPETFSIGAELRQLKTAMLRQIAKFEFEKEVVSRAYTLISGA